MRFLRRLLLRGIAFARRQLNHATHVLVYRRSLSAGIVKIGSMVDPGFEPDGLAVIHDEYFKTTRIFSIRFDNRHLMTQTPNARTMVLWQECMSQDGIRPLGLIEGDLLYTPYGQPTPVPRRYRELMEYQRARALENEFEEDENPCMSEPASAKDSRTATRRDNVLTA